MAEVGYDVVMYFRTYGNASLFLIMIWSKIESKLVKGERYLIERILQLEKTFIRHHMYSWGSIIASGPYTSYILYVNNTLPMYLRRSLEICGVAD